MKLGRWSYGKRPSGSAANRLRPWGTRIALAIGALAAMAVLTELGLRLCFRESFSFVEDEKNLMYRYDSELGWFPIPNSRKAYTGARTISVSHNSEGFRGEEFVNDREPRIVFLGDSFVWGVDVEVGERFTERLQRKHPEWSVYNLGVSGYGTDQEYLLLQRHYTRFRPQVVFLMYCAENDDSDNSWNLRHGGYYKPYCLLDGTRMKLAGIPVPRSYRVFCSEHPILTFPYLGRLTARAYFAWHSPPALHNPNPTGAILRDLQKYLQSRGTPLLIGLTRSHPHLEEFLQFFKIPYVDLSNPYRYATFGQHWTPEGHAFVADHIEKFLLDGRYVGGTVEPSPPE